MRASPTIRERKCDRADDMATRVNAIASRREIYCDKDQLLGIAEICPERPHGVELRRELRNDVLEIGKERKGMTEVSCHASERPSTESAYGIPEKCDDDAKRKEVDPRPLGIVLASGDGRWGTLHF